MKKIIIFFILVFVIVVGMSIDNPNLSEADLIKDQIEQFEKGNNNYYSPTSPDISNRIAKTGSSVINKVFDTCFDLINKIVN